MPGLREYKNGMTLELRARVIDAHDTGAIVVDVGGQHVALNQRNLDAADQAPDSARPETDEERDRRLMREQQPGA